MLLFNLDRLVAGPTSEDSTLRCTTQLGQGNYSETYTYDPATGNLANKAGVSYSYNILASYNSVNRTIAHAVSATGENTYDYDCNGNLTQRTTSGLSYTQDDNAENRLTGVRGAANTTFTYDGDARGVTGKVGQVTTA